MSMFCYQCEQTAQGSGCTKAGVCGKDAETASLQDLLFCFSKGLAMYAHRLRLLGVRDRQYDLAVIEALFTTVTNVNFDPARLEAMIRKVAGLRDQARDAYMAASRRAGRTPESLGDPSSLVPAAS
ncbi:MAG TPA: hydroxylamine reductase, partial [Acidobacteriota bacterium]|nr:hydroxylamine reductase [Acidobacteriota bacterium]